MSLAAKMKQFTISRHLQQQDESTGQKHKDLQQIGQIAAFVSPISRTPIDSQDRRFAEATDKLFSYDKAVDLLENDRLTNDSGEEFEVIWIDRTNKLLTATLKRQVFEDA